MCLSMIVFHILLLMFGWYSSHILFVSDDIDLNLEPCACHTEHPLTVLQASLLCYRCAYVL